MKRYTFTILLLAFLIGGAIEAHSLILGGQSLTRLDEGSVTSSAAAIGLINNTGEYPVEGKDYIVRSAKPLDGGDWAVLNISLNQSNSTATVILHKVDGAYLPVLGPGTLFSGSVLTSLPTDVGQYLTGKGLVDGQ
jgi:hypothetical protein